MTDSTEEDAAEFDQAEVNVTAPAIGLKIAGAISLYLGGMGLSGLFKEEEPLPAEPEPPVEAGEEFPVLDGILDFLEWLTGPGAWLITVSIVLHLLIGGLTIYAGTCFQKFEKRGLVKTAAWLIMIPLWCNTLVGIPMGIWTLITLRRDDVKKAFGRAA